MTATALSDTQLLDQARRGDEAAFTELYVRHQAAAYRLANSYRRAGDPDDLVNDAFERVLGALRKGRGPTESFRAYLFVTLRRLAAENISKRRDDPFEEVPEPVESEANTPGLDPADRTIVLQAFESMPERSQAVLWQTAVEGRDPKELAAVLGMSANAVAALAYRAREKLRQEYLQAHLQAAPKPDCEPHRSRLGAFVRDGLSRRDRTATEAHLDDCSSCTGLVSELLDINKVLSKTMVPVFAASAADIAGLAGGAAVGGGAAGAGGWAGKGVSKARNNPAGSAVVAGALAMALVAGLIASQQGGDDSPPNTSAGPPEEVEQAAPASPDDTPEPPPDEPEESEESEDPEEPDPETPPGDVSTARSPDEPPPPAPEEEEESAPRQEAPPAEETPTSPPPTRPPALSDPTPPTDPPPAVPTGPVVWNEPAGTVDTTLTNNGSTGSGLMLLNITLTGGAVVGGAPSGCNIAVALLVTTECVVGPIPPGGTLVVRQPVIVTGPGQRATVSQCRVGLIHLSCGGPPLRTTTVVLD